MFELKCQHCGETFVAKRRDAKWCSNSCRCKFKRLANPERTRAWERKKAKKLYRQDPSAVVARVRVYKRRRRAEKAEGAMNIFLMNKGENE